MLGMVRLTVWIAGSISLLLYSLADVDADVQYAQVHRVSSLYRSLAQNGTIQSFGQWDRRSLTDVHDVCAVFSLMEPRSLISDLVLLSENLIVDRNLSAYTSKYVLWHVAGQFLAGEPNVRELITDAYLADQTALRWGDFFEANRYAKKEVYASLWHGALWEKLSHASDSTSFVFHSKVMCHDSKIFYEGECWHGVGHAAYYHRYAATHSKFNACTAITPGSYAMPLADLESVVALCTATGRRRCHEGAMHSYLLYWPWHRAHPSPHALQEILGKGRSMQGYPFRILFERNETDRDLTSSWRAYLVGATFLLP